MKTVPEGITTCRLQCILMPQGEIICNGKTIGWFKDMKPYLKTEEQYDGLLDACKNFHEWHANHFEDFNEQINGELLSLANDAEQAIDRVAKIFNIDIVDVPEAIAVEESVANKYQQIEEDLAVEAEGIAGLGGLIKRGMVAENSENGNFTLTDYGRIMLGYLSDDEKEKEQQKLTLALPVFNSELDKWRKVKNIDRDIEYNKQYL